VLTPTQEIDRNRLENDGVLSRSKATAFSEEPSDEDTYDIREKKQYAVLANSSNQTA